MDDRLKKPHPVTKRVPQVKYPKNLEDWYAREIRKFVRTWQTTANMCLQQELKPYILGGGAIKLDADNSKDETWFERVKSAIDLMAFTIQRSQSDSLITKLATRFVRAIDHFSYQGVSKQTAIVGLNPIGTDANLRDYTKGKIEENVSLIKTMRSNYFHSLQNDIYRSITKGGGASSITSAITQRTHMANNHARLIANDQTGTIISNVNAYRAKNAGAQKYVWRSMEDERVRPKHRKLDGKTFSYDDPHGGDDGQLPGEPINCRCFATPVF